jgi:hypothetical protein
MKKMSLGDWLKSPYIPKVNELCLSADTLDIRFGDGVNTWKNLKGDLQVGDTLPNGDEVSY